MLLALSMPIFNKKFHQITNRNIIKVEIFVRACDFLLKIVVGTLRDKDIRKNVPVLQVSALASPYHQYLG